MRGKNQNVRKHRQHTSRYLRKVCLSFYNRFQGHSQPRHNRNRGYLIFQYILRGTNNDCWAKSFLVHSVPILK